MKEASDSDQIKRSLHPTHIDTYIDICFDVNLLEIW